ncbi:hypothetical protein ACFPM7_24395 [Actinokineospora guangxiensis]|uniref:Hsp70 protein n=1 Tax=Actinokineospora guangxiensis TaxID=1490288 RepID=A0ABW0EVN9_9PSEU
MPYVLGVDVGRTSGAAAVCRHDGPPAVVIAGVPAVLAVAGGRMEVGARALGADPGQVAADLLDQVGDDVPVLLDGVAYTAHDLLAALVAAVVDQVADGEGAPPDRLAVTHPPGWGAYRRGLLRDALAEAGFPGALLLPTPVAAAEFDHFRAPLAVGRTVAVALVGGRHVEFAVLSRGPAAFDLLDHAAPAEPDAGAALDDLLADLGGRLLKERLSTAAEVRVADAVVTRAAFADLARPLLTRTTDALHAYLAAHRPERALLAGGTARVPLLAELLPGLPTPTTIPEDPATVPARGAALAARLRLPAPRTGSIPGFAPVAAGVLGHGGGSDPALRPVAPGRAGGAGSNPALRPVAGRDLSPVPAREVELLETVVSHPGFPPVTLADDVEPPPRPPVEITPLRPPPRRFGRRGRRG